ncbi:UNVERIFIED_CONTAM: hypothetical protein ABID98_003943 [Brevibacillus sp. OAP136]
MMISIRLAFLLCGAIFILIALFLTGLYLIQLSWKRQIGLSRMIKKSWRQFVGTQISDKWERLLLAAGKPFGWGKLEWVTVQWICGLIPLLLVLLVALVKPTGSFPFLSFVILPTIGYLTPYFLLRWWKGLREELLSVDIARFINRFITLLENQVPPYQAMVKAARPTRLLKKYIPSLSEWNKSRVEALEMLKQRIGVDDGVILVSNMRTLEQLTDEQINLTMQRMELAIDNRRMYMHRKKIKSLGLAYSVIVYPAFYIGLIVAMFPWYKLLTEILDKYLV